MTRELKAFIKGSQPKDPFEMQCTVAITLEETDKRTKKAITEELKDFAFEQFNGRYKKENIKIKFLN